MRIPEPMQIALRSALLFSTLVCGASAQLIPVGTAIPKTTKPPVVFLNGYEYGCTTSSAFADTFGKFDQFLQNSSNTGRVTLFFDNCGYGKISIEDLGNRFSTFLAGLKYQDGTAVTQVDVVAHSMGGLILRSYLAGMQRDPTSLKISFQPPANPGIRKMVFLATPNFGTDVAAILGSDIQTQELSTASTFVFNLGTWNQGSDDLRGVDTLSVAGNNGTATLGGNSDTDGVSTLTSSSVGFALPGRTRVVPYCHISSADLISISFLFGTVCKSNSPGIAKGVNGNDVNVQIVQSFLNDTPDWQNIGEAAEKNAVLTTQGGVILRAKSTNDQFVTMQDAAAGTTNLSVSSASGNTVAYKEFLAPGSLTAKATTTAGVQQQPVTISAGYTTAVTLKSGPVIGRVLPAAAVVSPLNVAPGTFVAIYGAGFATTTMTAPSAPFPTTLNGVQVLVNGTAIPLYFVAPTQIDAVFPLTVSGLVTVNVTSSGTQSSVHVLVAPAVPAIFTQDSSGSGAASALNAITNTLISPAAPLKAGDYVSIYLTGLGAKTPSNGVQVANIQPTVTIGGQPCTVQFAGATRDYAGLDQVNCQVPAGVSSPMAPVVVTSGGRASNTVTLAIQ